MSDDLLKKTLDLFEPFQPDENSDGGKGNDVREPEPSPVKKPTETAQSPHTDQPKRSRRWETETPSYHFRIRSEDVERIMERADELEVSRDAIAAALIQSGLDALDTSHLQLTTKKSVKAARDILGRKYDRGITEITWIWSCESTT